VRTRREGFRGKLDTAAQGKRKYNNDKKEGDEEAGDVRSRLKAESSTAHDD
jgi:hypothetical protein